jgi:hypothetical protein
VQCRAEIPHLKAVIPDFKEQSVAFIAINTRDPEGQVNAEIKRYKLDYPCYYGRGQNINEGFKVLVLPRLIIVRKDGTVYKDVPFMKSDEMKADIQKLLEEDAASGQPNR